MLRIRWNSSWAEGDDIELDIPWIQEETPLAKKLEQVFRACNHVDGSEIEVVNRFQPSMSGGDIVYIGEDVFYCASIGWARVTDMEALKAYLNMPRRDRHFLAPEFGEDGNLSRKTFTQEYKTLEPVT